MFSLGGGGTLIGMIFSPFVAGWFLQFFDGGLVLSLCAFWVLRFPRGVFFLVFLTHAIFPFTKELFVLLLAFLGSFSGGQLL